MTTTITHYPYLSRQKKCLEDVAEVALDLPSLSLLLEKMTNNVAVFPPCVINLSLRLLNGIMKVLGLVLQLLHHIRSIFG